MTDRIVVGGVGELYQGDLDLGRRAVERLHINDLGAEVLLEDFSYGAVAVAQRLAELRPNLLVLVGAIRRGRAPGAVERRVVAAAPRTPLDAQRYIADAVTGYVDVDLVVEVAAAFGMLPPRTVVIEVEPERCEPAEELSAVAEAALARALALIVAEVHSGSSLANP